MVTTCTAQLKNSLAPLEPVTPAVELRLAERNSRTGHRDGGLGGVLLLQAATPPSVKRRPHRSLLVIPTRHARRSDTRRRFTRKRMASRRRVGLTSFPAAGP